MPLQSYTPSAPLSRYVEAIWSMSNAGLPSSRQRVYPHGAMELVIHLGGHGLSFFDGEIGQRFRVPLLAGAYSKSFLIDPSEFTAVLGVRFKPGAAKLFFPIPAHILHNSDVALEEIYPQEAKQLLDDLVSAKGLQAQLTRLERYLIDKLPKSIEVHPAVEHAVKAFQLRAGVPVIAHVQSETGLSHTRFIQLFRESVGLTPKLFCRVQRFRNALERIEHGMPVRWAELAVECGYSDQAHLIHDFREFSGLTPSAYAEIERQSDNKTRPARRAS